MKKEKNNRNFDLSYLKELGKENNFILSLIDLFITSSEEDLELLDKYYIDKNWDKLGDLAHKLRSRTLHFNMIEVASLLKEIEMRCQNKMINEKLKLLVKKMKTSYLIILKELKVESLTLTVSKG